MLSKISNLDGVSVLNKKEQATVNGGLQTCRITTSYLGFSMTFETVFSDGPAGSGEANDYCVDIIVSGNASSCGYDCEYDGFGQ